MSSSQPFRVAVIGAGMSGILAAIRCREIGVEVTVFEKAERVGGTWRENTYPGIACDVPSHLYSYSFALNPEWDRTYAAGADIQAYFEKVAADHGVLDAIEFGAEITHAEFADEAWTLTTHHGRRAQFDVVIAATGVLHHPNLPAIDGLETFAGACFHSARWDHDVAVDGARVGVIGTGSTAIQITSAVAGRAAEYVLFQRTAQWVLPADNPAYSEAQKAEYRSNPDALRHSHDTLNEVFTSAFSNTVIHADSRELQELEDACRANLEDNVADPELREALRPMYKAACKRLVVSPDFYEAIQRPGARVVVDGISHVEPGGVRTNDGTLHELDVLVLATGFHVDKFIRPIDVIGPDGLRLEDVWAERPTAYYSMSIPGLPNLFLLNGPNGPIGNFSLIEVAERQFDYIAQLIQPLRDGTATRVCATAEANAAYEAARVEAAKDTVWVTGCRSWYLDDRGIPAAWPWTYERFVEVMETPDWNAFDVVTGDPT